MFRETYTHAGGITKGYASEAQATSILVQAVRRGHAIEATAAGGAIVTWTRHLAERSIVLDPYIPVGALADTVRDDLAHIDADPDTRYEFVHGRRVIAGTLWRIPPFDTTHLRTRKLVTEHDDAPVRLTLTARLGLLALDRRRTVAAVLVADRLTVPTARRVASTGGARTA